MSGATVGQCGNASPGNGRHHPCGISNYCTLPAGHLGWHQQDQARWGKPWSDDAEDTALAVLADLVAGADDHRCWFIPDEIAGRARALLAEAAS